MSEVDNSQPTGTAHAERRGRGPGRRFEPGRSGNPAGRPKGTLASVIRAATGDGKLLVDVLVAVVTNDAERLGATPKVADRISAASILFDRGWGKAPPLVDGEQGTAAVVVEVVTYAREPGDAA